MSGLELGLLDLCHVAPGATSATALCDMTDVACLADGLGYSRYWLAEHHTSAVAHASPEILIPLVAGMTDRIRVGTAGVLLPYRSLLKVASDFRLLATLFPRRIDLGMGRGRAPAATAEALLFGRADDTSEAMFDRMFGDVVHFLTGTVTEDHPNYQAWVSPARLEGAMPQVFGLGSSRRTLPIAAAHGAPFAYSLFIEGGGDDPEIFGEYRRRFRVGPLGTKPLAILTLAGVCAETDETAKAICQRDNDGLIPTVVGAAETCRTMLLTLRDRYAADEIVFVEIAKPLSDRLRSCELLSSALEMRRVPHAVPA